MIDADDGPWEQPGSAKPANQNALFLFFFFFPPSRYCEKDTAQRTPCAHSKSGAAAPAMADTAKYGSIKSEPGAYEAVQVRADRAASPPLARVRPVCSCCLQGGLWPRSSSSSSTAPRHRESGRTPCDRRPPPRARRTLPRPTPTPLDLIFRPLSLPCDALTAIGVSMCWGLLRAARRSLRARSRVPCVHACARCALACAYVNACACARVCIAAPALGCASAEASLLPQQPRLRRRRLLRQRARVHACPCPRRAQGFGTCRRSRCETTRARARTHTHTHTHTPPAG